MSTRRLAGAFLVVATAILLLLPAASLARTLERAGVSTSQGRIAFVCDGDIWVMKADGSGTRRLTRTTQEEWSPTWSPDGKRIAFLRGSDPPYRGRVYMMRADGSQQKELKVKLPNQATYPRNRVNRIAWSALGGTLALASSRTPGGLYSHLWQLVLVDLRTLQGRRLGDEGYLGVAYALNWRPDDAQIAISYAASASLGELLHLCTATDGSAVTAPDFWQPKPPSPELAAIIQTVAWSPDGKKVAYCAHRDWHNHSENGERCVLAMMALDKSSHGLIATSRTKSHFLGSPTWSPNGTMLAYDTRTSMFASPSTGSSVRVYDVATKKIRTLASNAAEPAWSLR